jgi:FecR-like protein
MEISMTGIQGFRRVVAIALALGAFSSAHAADDGAWSVSKSSGEVWMAGAGAQQVSLGQQDVLKPGDTIRTGRNGRVLLVRGEETILVAPNSVIGLPTEKKDGLATTIVQQAGSILLEVEKRNVRHFEVETPYLAAVVKGTRFRVSVTAGRTSVDVIRGQVEVSDFRSGQIAQVLPGQAATVFAHGKSGLSLSGSGAFRPIEHGQPRASSIERIMLPKAVSAPRHASNGPSIRAMGHGVRAANPVNSRASLQPHRNADGARHGVTRISA